MCRHLPADTGQANERDMRIDQVNAKILDGYLANSPNRHRGEAHMDRRLN
jgi:hypothetical protein